MLTILHALESPVIESLGWALVHFVWQATLLAGLLALLLVPLRRGSARVRYLVQCAMLVVMTACPVVTWWWIASTMTPHEPLAVARVKPVIANQQTIAIDEPAVGPMVTSQFETGEPIMAAPIPTTTVVAAPPVAVPMTSPDSAVSWNERVQQGVAPILPWLVTAWLLGVVVLSLRLLVGWRIVQRLKRLAVKPVAETWHLRLKHLAGRLGITRTVKLVESALIEVPTVIGWLRPVILLPVSLLTSLTPQQLEAVLAHELAHIRRHDYLVNLIQTAIETLLFYHPAVWWLSRLIRDEREHCCDDLALSLCDNPITYVSALAAMEELRTSPALTLAASGGSLLSRIRRIALGPENDCRKSIWWGASLIILTTLVALGLTTYITLHAGDEPPAKRQAARIVSPSEPISEASDEAKAGLRPLNDSAESSPPVGLEFLNPYPKLHGLSLDMTMPQFLEIVKQQELKAMKKSEGDTTAYHMKLGDGLTLIVMFRKDGTCRGIQRIRGEGSAADTRSQAELENEREPATADDRDVLRRLIRGGKIDSKTIHLWVTQVARAGARDDEFARLVLAEFEKSNAAEPRTNRLNRDLLAVMAQLFEAWSEPRWKAQLASRPANVLPEVEMEFLKSLIKHAYSADRGNIAEFTLAARMLHHSASRDFLRDVLRNPERVPVEPFAPAAPSGTSPTATLAVTPTVPQAVPQKNAPAAKSKWQDNIGGGWADAEFVAAVGLAELNEAEGVEWLLSKARDNDFGLDDSLFYNRHARDPRGSLRASSRLALTDLFSLNGTKSEPSFEQLEARWQALKPKFVARPVPLMLGLNRPQQLIVPAQENAADARTNGEAFAWHAGTSPIRLQRFPIEGETLTSVRHLDPLTSTLSEAVQREAAQRFNAALKAIDRASPQQFDASIDRLISESRDLPPIYRAALMSNLMMVSHEWLGREQFQHAGFEGTLFERVKHKCAMTGLAQPDEIPVGLALRLLEFATASQLAMNTDDDANWPAQRRLKTFLWLTQLEKVRRVIDPNWDESDRPQINNEVIGTNDPQKRAEYEREHEANRLKAERYNEQMLARRLLAELSPRMEELLIRLYVRKPLDAAQLDSLLQQHASVVSQRDRVSKTVRLFNAIIPGGTQMKYGWPDGLAEAGVAGVPQLMVAVQDRTYPKFIRHDGAWALGLIGDPRALPVLIEVAQDEATPEKYKDIAREFVRALREKNDQARLTPSANTARSQAEPQNEKLLRADVPNGVRLELVGLSTIHTGTSKPDQRQWWDARGEVIGSTETLLDEKRQMRGMSEYSQGREAIVRLTVQRDSPFVEALRKRAAWIESEVDGVSSTPAVFAGATAPLLFHLAPNGQVQDDERMELQLHTHFVPNADAKATRLRFGFGHEATSRTYDDKGKLSHETHVKEHPEIWRRFSFLKMESRTEGTVVWTKPTRGLGDLGRGSVRLLLIDGTVLNSVSPKLSESSDEEQHVFSKINLTDIEGITLSVRTVTHWVSFSGLPLNAEPTSDATIDVQTVKHLGLEFLKPYPKLHGLSLNMTEPQFLEIVKQQKLQTRKTVEANQTGGEKDSSAKVTHHIALGDGHTLLVMFDKDAKCSGIQRIHGEDAEDGAVEQPAIVRATGFLKAVDFLIRQQQADGRWAEMGPKGGRRRWH